MGDKVMKNKIKTIDEIKVYKEYIKAKRAEGYSVVKLCEKLNISRSSLYELVKRIEKGDKFQLERCMKITKFDCIWEHKYKRRFIIISDNRKEKEYPEQLRVLIVDMDKDGFGLREIARRVMKDVHTVSYHLNKE